MTKIGHVSKKGYTLVELLVTLTIIGILFGFSYAGFRGYSRREELDLVRDQVLNELKITQQKALSGAKPNNTLCNSPNFLSGYSVSFNSNKFTISASCLELVETKVSNIPAGYTITSDTDPLVFKVLGQGTNTNLGATISIIQSATGATRTINISSTGEFDLQ